MQILAYGALMLVLFLAVFRWPAVALGGLLCTYGLQQFLQTGSFTGGETPLSLLHNRMIGSIVVLAGVVAWMRQGGRLPRPPAVFWVVMALYGWALLSWTWSVYPAGWVERWQLAWLTIITFTVLAPPLIVRPRDLRDAIHMVLVLGPVVMLLLLTTADLAARGVMLTAVGAVGNPLALGSLAAYSLIAAVLMNFRGVARIWQVLRWGVTAVALLVMVMIAQARGQFLGVLAVVLVFLPMSRRVRNLRGFVATAAGIFLTVVLAMWVLHSYGDPARWGPAILAETYRASRLDDSLFLLGQWLQGGPGRWLVGLGNSAAFDPQLLGTYPHIVVAEVVAEEGLIGCALLLGILAMSVRSIRRLYPVMAPHPEARGLLATLAALAGFEFILSFKEGSLIGNAPLFTFLIVVGCFEQAVRRHQAAAAALPVPALSQAPARVVALGA